MTDIKFPKYDDTDPDRLTFTKLKLVGDEIVPVEVPETVEARRARKKLEAKQALEQAALIPILEADPNSSQGTISFAPGQSPEELAAAEPPADLKLTPVTELEQIELDNGFIFGTGTHPETAGAKAIATLVCTTPTCDRRGEHLQINADTLLPVKCGGCNRILHCNHQWEPRATTEGTLTAPTSHTWDHCPTCDSTRNHTRKAETPINLADLPATLLNQLTPNRAQDEEESGTPL